MFYFFLDSKAIYILSIGENAYKMLLPEKAKEILLKNKTGTFSNHTKREGKRMEYDDRNVVG